MSKPWFEFLCLAYLMLPEINIQRMITLNEWNIVLQPGKQIAHDAGLLLGKSCVTETYLRGDRICNPLISPWYNLEIISLLTFYFYFEAGSKVAGHSLKLTMKLSMVLNLWSSRLHSRSGCWDPRHVPSCLVSTVLETELRALCMSVKHCQQSHPDPHLTFSHFPSMKSMKKWYNL